MNPRKRKLYEWRHDTLGYLEVVLPDGVVLQIELMDRSAGSNMLTIRCNTGRLSVFPEASNVVNIKGQVGFSC